MEELQGAKRKQDKEMEALQDRIDELSADNHKVVKSKKKIQEEASLLVGEGGREMGALECVKDLFLF